LTQLGLAALACKRYNVRVRRPLPKGLLLLAVAAVALATLTSAQGGVFPGNNGLIAYTCGTNICNIDPNSLIKTTPFIGGASDPSWSSDEASIAYTSTLNGISVADSDGTNPVPLAPAAGSSQPTFSFDGLSVAYVRAGLGIYTINSDGTGGETAIAGTAPSDVDPAYSPDGSKIAFARNDGVGTGFDIWTVTVPGGVLHQVTNAAGNERSPSWSKSGSTIVYSADLGGSSHELLATPAAGTTGAGTQDLNVAGTDPAYSPDGTKIAFITLTGGLSMMVASVGGAVTPLDTNSGNSQPDWQAVFASSGSSGPPVNVSYPTVNLSFGDTAPTLGDFLTASIGSWSGAFPISYTYQWKRCDAADPVNGQCVDIAGGRSSFYTPVLADYGKRLRVQVTGTNSQGSTSQNSEVTAPVTADGVVLRVTPQISDSTPVVDAPLSL